MPIAASSRPVMPARSSACVATLNCVRQISSASCSTHPGCGKIWRNSCCAAALIAPLRSNTIARELVVPWSSASMNDMALLSRAQSTDSHCILVRTHASFLDELAPLLQLALQMLGKLLRRARNDIDAFLRKTLREVRRPHDLSEIFAELRQDGLGQAGRCQQAVPGGELVTRKTRLGNRRKFGNRRRAFR